MDLEQNMKTFQEYVEEIEQHYKDIQSKIIALVPFIQEKLDVNPSDRALIYSFDILKRIISNIKILEHIKYNDISCVGYRLILRATIGDIIEGLFYLNAADNVREAEFRKQDLEFLRHLENYAKDTYRFFNNRNPKSLKGIDIGQLKQNFSQYVDPQTGEFFVVSRNNPKLGLASMMDQLIKQKIVSKEYKQLYSSYRLLSFTEHYTILGRRYSYNEEMSILLIVDSVRWLMIGCETLCSSIKEIVEKS